MNSWTKILKWLVKLGHQDEPIVKSNLRNFYKKQLKKLMKYNYSKPQAKQKLEKYAKRALGDKSMTSYGAFISFMEYFVDKDCKWK